MAKVRLVTIDPSGDARSDAGVPEDRNAYAIADTAGGFPSFRAVSPVAYGGASAEDGFPVAGIWRRKHS